MAILMGKPQGMLLEVHLICLRGNVNLLSEKERKEREGERGGEEKGERALRANLA